MADYSASFTKHRAYTVDKATLVEIIQIAKTFLGKDPDISIHLRDDHQIEDTNLNALLADTYVRGKYIERVTIGGRSRSQDVMRSFLVDFEWELLSVIRVNVSGERDRSIAARDEIENILKGAEFWYSPMFLPKTRFLFLLASMLVPVTVGIALTLYLTWLVGLKVGTESISIWALPIGVGLAMIYLTLKDRLFPKITFNIGRSANRARYAGYWRNFIFTSVLVGIVFKLSIDHFLR
jgi:hypothetical protein